MYSDLSEIYSYTSKSESPKNMEALQTLFAEVVKDTKEIGDTNLKLGEMREIMDNLYWLLSIVLRLSVIHEIYIPPRD